MGNVALPVMEAHRPWVNGVVAAELVVGDLGERLRPVLSGLLHALQQRRTRAIRRAAGGAVCDKDDASSGRLVRVVVFALPLALIRVMLHHISDYFSQKEVWAWQMA